MEKISIAKVLKPQGLKGELKCKALTENLEIYASLNTVICNNKTYKVISGVARLGFVYIMLDGVSSRDDAELFRNKILYIPKSEYGDLDKDNYFIEDLIGIKIYSQSNEYVGDILDVENYGATDILIVKEGVVSFSVPFLKDIFTDVNVSAGIAKINTEIYNQHKISY